MTKEEKVNLIELRIRFLSVWKEVTTRREAFKPMMEIFQLLEEDYDRCLVPEVGEEQVYLYFKSPDNFERIISTKLGKYLRKRYKDLVPADHILSDFVAILNAIVWKKAPSIQIYKGDDLLKAYGRCEKGAVSSCMTKRTRLVYMKLLAQNPDVVEMHCLEDVEKIHARVLVWKLEDGKRVVDRIYPNNGKVYHDILEHFKGMDNHYIRSNHGASSETTPAFITGINDPQVVLDATGIDKYPYLDTFQYGYQDGNNIHLSNIRFCACTMKFDTQYGTVTHLEHYQACRASYPEEYNIN